MSNQVLPTSCSFVVTTLRWPSAVVTERSTGNTAGATPSEQSSTAVALNRRVPPDGIGRSPDSEKTPEAASPATVTRIGPAFTTATLPSIVTRPAPPPPESSPATATSSVTSEACRAWWRHASHWRIPMAPTKKPARTVATNTYTGTRLESQARHELRTSKAGLVGRSETTPRSIAPSSWGSSTGVRMEPPYRRRLSLRHPCQDHPTMPLPAATRKIPKITTDRENRHRRTGEKRGENPSSALSTPNSPTGTCRSAALAAGDAKARTGARCHQGCALDHTFSDPAQCRYVACATGGQT